MIPRVWIRLILTALIICLPLAAQAAASKKQPAQAVARKGSLPESGRVTLRSGLAWMDEKTMAFMAVEKELGPLLTKQGLSLVSVAPTALAPMPKTPLPQDADALAAPGMVQTGSQQKAEDAEAQRKAAELAREGKLPQLKLRGYSTPKRDAELPQSVRSIAAPDVTTALFALSQQKGLPVLRNGSGIPGRLPAELQNADPKVADYAIVVRFAAIQPMGMSGMLQRLPAFAEQHGVLVAAVGGVGALGVGPPAAPSSTGRTNYGTPRGYVRGYEGSSPSDIWNRDSDFFTRDYKLKNSPPSPVATPPGGFSDSPGGAQRSAPRSTYRGTVSRAGWYVLEMDCYDLAPAREGKAPQRVWQAAVEQAEIPQGLIAALPQMVQAIFANQGE